MRFDDILDKAITFSESEASGDPYCCVCGNVGQERGGGSEYSLLGKFRLKRFGFRNTYQTIYTHIYIFILTNCQTAVQF